MQVAVSVLYIPPGPVAKDHVNFVHGQLLAGLFDKQRPIRSGVLQAGFGDDIRLTENLAAPDSADTLADITEINALGPRLAVDLPHWWVELQALLGTIILATTTKTGKSFAGASAFDVWGAILINPRYRSDRLHLALTMVHEGSHLKLFYGYLDNDIVLNAPEQVFSTPLRRQLRPMNGIYHAAFVLARMALFVTDIGRTKVGAQLFGVLGHGWQGHRP